MKHTIRTTLSNMELYSTLMVAVLISLAYATARGQLCRVNGTWTTLGDDKICCSGKVEEKDDISDKACCYSEYSGEFYDRNRNICCHGRIFPRYELSQVTNSKREYGCCGNKNFSLSTHFCCGHDLHKKESGCQQGYYGLNCSMLCSSSCSCKACSQKDGTCLKGCIAGYYGNYCNTSCPDTCRTEYDGLPRCNMNSDGALTCVDGCQRGYYGLNCSMVCSNSCSYNTCNQNGGTCFQCSENRYGQYCEKPCNDKCRQGCNRDGTCLKGCKAGYYGNYCNISCPDTCMNRTEYAGPPRCNMNSDGVLTCVDGCQRGYYGLNCNMSCSNSCSNSTCFQDGICISCTKANYGPFCEKTCKCRHGCHKNGNCIDVCKPSADIEYCDHWLHNCMRSSDVCARNLVCDDRWYGISCNKLCHDGCLKVSCYKNGTCMEGCTDGFYGLNCDKQCSRYCKDNVCNWTSGQCLECEDEWYGEDCDTECSDSCFEKMCDRTGRCKQGLTVWKYLSVIVGVSAAVMIIAVIVCVWWRLNKQYHLQCICAVRELQQSDIVGDPADDVYLAANLGYDSTDGYAYIDDKDIDTYYCSIDADIIRPTPCRRRACFGARESNQYEPTGQTDSLQFSMSETVFGNLFEAGDSSEGIRLGDFQADNDNYQAVAEDENETFGYLTLLE